MIFQNNITQMTKRNPQLAMQLSQNYETAHLNFVQNEGYYNLHVLTSQGMVPLYQDGVLEQIKKDTNNLDLAENKSSVLLGFDLGYLAKEIGEKMQIGHMLLIVERDISMMKLAMSVIDFTSLIDNNRVMFLAGNNIRIDQWIPKMSTRFIGGSINIIQSNISIALFPEFYNAIKAVVNESANNVQVNAILFSIQVVK